MAVIPEFERRKLASSVVGTPGVDTSGQEIAQTVSGVANQAVQTFGEQAIKKKEIQDAAQANKTLVDFDVELEKAYVDHQKNYKNDPTNKTDFFTDNAKQILDGFVNGTSSPRVRAAVEREGQARIGQKAVTEVNWADHQATQNTVDAVVTTSDTLANEAYIAGLNQNYERMNEVFAQNEKQVDAAKMVLGADDVKKLQKSVKMGAINGMLEQHPEVLHDLLSKQGFADVLDAGEVKKLKTESLDQVKRMKETADTQYLASQIENHPVLWDRYVNGTLTYQEIDQIDDPQFANELKQLWLKGKPYTPEDKRDKYMDLYGQTVDLIKGQGTSAHVTRGTLEDAIKLQSKIVGAAREGSLSEEDASSLLKKFAVPVTKKLKSASDWGGVFNGLSDPYKRAFKGVTADAKRYNLTPSTQASILVQFDQELAKMGDEPGAAQVDEAYGNAYKDVIRKVKPEILKSQDVPNATGSKKTGVTPIYAGTSQPGTIDRVIKQAKAQIFKAGDERTKVENGVTKTYVRQEDGSWQAKP